MAPRDPVTELQVVKSDLYRLRVREQIAYPDEKPKLAEQIADLEGRAKALAPQVKKLKADAIKRLKKSAAEYADARRDLVRALGHRRDPGLQVTRGTQNI